MSDMRNKCYENKRLLTEIVTKPLTTREKELIKVAMEFGYATAFCSRTCDMTESYFAGSSFDDDYKHILKVVE